MSYRYIDSDRDTLRMEGVLDAGDTYVAVVPRRGEGRSVRIPNADAPTVASELLKAAGRDDLAGYLAAVVEKEAAAAEWAAKEAAKKLQERRENLANELSGGIYKYANVAHSTQQAIDRIIDLQDASCD